MKLIKLWEVCLALGLLGYPVCVNHVRSSETYYCSFSLYALVLLDISSLHGSWNFFLFEEGH